MAAGRPPLRLLDDLRERAIEAEMEAGVLRDEMRATARRLRLVLLRPIWSTDAFAPVAKPLIEEAERLERKAGTPGRAA